MAIIKVLELLSNSKKSWEDATQNAVKHAAKSLRNIRGVNVSNMSAVVDKKGTITEFRVNVKISFEVE
jgi:dodecin